MAAWREVVATAPEFAATAQGIFDAHKHKTIATLRADGSPRISGIEASFHDGELLFGSMPGARKGRDLVRDPRFALHSASVDPPADHPSGWSGDAKVSGRAVEITEPRTGQAQQFRAEIDDVVITRVGVPPDHLVIELWRPGEGVRRFERR